MQLGGEDAVGDSLLCKTDDDALLSRATGCQRGKCSSVRFQCLTSFLLYRVQLHEAFYQLGSAACDAKVQLQTPLAFCLSCLRLIDGRSRSLICGFHTTTMELQGVSGSEAFIIA